MKTFYTNLSVLAERPKSCPSPREMEMLRIADALASSSNCTPHKVGAVLFRRNRVLGRGFNKTTNHPFQFRWNHKSTTLHAEMHALLLASKDREHLDGASIAVARRARNGLNGCSFPCNRCMPALLHSGIASVICFSENDEPVRVNMRCD